MTTGLPEIDWDRRAHPAAALYRIVLAQPLIVLALWSRAWVGWSSLILIALAIAAWRLAPRLASPAGAGADSWATLATRGERLRREGAFPAEARTLGRAELLAGAAFGTAVIGALVLHRPLAALGTTVCLLANLWLADRLAQLYAARATDSFPSTDSGA